MKIYKLNEKLIRENMEAINAKERGDSYGKVSHYKHIIEVSEGRYVICCGDEGFRRKDQLLTLNFFQYNQVNGLRTSYDLNIRQAIKGGLIVESDVKLHEVVRKFGSRLESNFRMLLDTLGEFGADQKTLDEAWKLREQK